MPRIEVELGFDHEQCFGCEVVGNCPAGEFITKVTTDITDAAPKILEKYHPEVTEAMVQEDTDGTTPMRSVTNRILDELLGIRQTYIDAVGGLDKLFVASLLAQNKARNRFVEPDGRAVALAQAAEEFQAIYPAATGLTRGDLQAQCHYDETNLVQSLAANEASVGVLEVPALQACADGIINYHNSGQCSAVQLAISPDKTTES